ncbi:MAG: YbaK/EbsC family protein [Verrucomicrobiales bacterium]|nr:YbaK/EbsC family protein [Verrucomicrobiales bacterium]
MPARKLKAFLNENRVKYVSIRHSPAYTAQEVAASTHISGRDIAKTVLLKTEQGIVMLVLPADRHVNLDEAERALGVGQARLATEEEFKRLFPDCEPGAMPPFGNLYDLPVYVAPSLTAETEIAFNAGSHTEVIRMAYADFADLVHPIVVEFSA